MGLLLGVFARMVFFAVDLGGNIIEVAHNRLTLDVPAKGAEFDILIETRDSRHTQEIIDALRERGWLVPAYTFPRNRQDLAALRIVVRRGFTHDVADLLLADFERQLPRLRKQAAPVNAGAAASFHH